MARLDRGDDGGRFGVRLMGRGGDMLLFRTRSEAREWIEKEYGYLRTRPDLQAEPHGWKMPIPVRVVIGVDMGETK